ncbi:hypothetical protein [Jiangella asiatica]|uniref:Uncharacterized protein n=1 Tax=Jiangella asiatica TaxID=2530372 RepID=A0A4R5D3T9_9ACTN|nr:hypothetical protein [Jiangella asiatica]TDE07906.1 hypothetical protein E1269_19245 [Jiangella asiatica]
MDADRSGRPSTPPGATRRGRRAARARLITTVLAGVAAPLMLTAAAPVASAADSTPAGATPPATPAESTPAAVVDQPNVVLLGIAGLAWPDVTAEDTPTLYEMAGSAAAGSLTVRTVRSRTCVVDGWLSVSSGRRATDVYDTDADDENDRFCRQVPEPSPDGTGGAVVPGWEALVQQQEDNSYNAEIGLVGDRLAEAGVCATAVGPGAAMALADSTGRVASYQPFSGEIDQQLLSRCPVTVIDLGGLPSPAPAGSDDLTEEAALETRRQVTAGIDQLVARILDELPPDTALLIAGLSDSAATSVPLPDQPTPIPPAGLRAAFATGPVADGDDTFGGRWLTSSSTLWPGLVQLTDIAPTLLTYAGVEDPARDVAGRHWRPAGEHAATSAATVAELTGVDQAAQIYRVQSGPFFQVLGIVQVIVFAAAVLALRRRSSYGSIVLRVVQVVAVTAAAAPVASYLANITRWWRYDNPNVVLWTSIVVSTVALTVVALAGPWRKRAYGPPGVVAGVTATVLAVDVASGSSLQQSSLLGLSPLVAGRFYGFGNIPFAIFVVASLVAAAALGQFLIDRGRSRRYAATAVGVVGLIAVVVDGAPQAGADVGGILAAIPGFAVLVLGTLGARVTVPRVVLAGVGATVLFGLFAFLDWLRPAGSRTHFGGFFDDLLSGEALTVILRKAEASIGTLERWPIYGWLVPLAYLLILWLTRRDGAAAMAETVRQWSLMRYLVWASLLTGAAGFAANDSGIIVPALLLTVGVPLGVAAVAAAQRLAPAKLVDDAELVAPSR